MTGRHYGDGSIWKDEKTGLYVGSAYLGTADGKTRRKVVKGKTKAVVQGKLRAVLTAKEKGLPVPMGSGTVGDWLDHWISIILPERVAESSRRSYESIVQYYIIPDLGSIQLLRLQPENIEAMMAGLRARGLSVRTANYARRILTMALKEAERRQKVPRNVALLTDPYKEEGTKLDDRMSATEVDAVLDAVVGDRLEALAVLVLATGMRQGEALRLTWSDVDLVAGKITVPRSITKTDAGARTIALPRFVATALRDHRRKMAAEQLACPIPWSAPELVFPRPEGVVYRSRDILYWWHGLLARAGVRRRRFHATRHTAATIMLNRGVTLEVVSATLGHSSLAITNDIYAKVEPDLQRQAADVMDDLFGNR